jgi:pimeloyl-ACP methyl ester carboxylesterase
MNVDIPVLIVYGSSGPATSADEGRYLTSAINSFHPGRAEFVQIEGMDHSFNRAPSLHDALDTGKQREFHTGVLDVVSKWLDGQVR